MRRPRDAIIHSNFIAIPFFDPIRTNNSQQVFVTAVRAIVVPEREKEVEPPKGKKELRRLVGTFSSIGVNIYEDWLNLLYKKLTLVKNYFL